MSPRRHSVDLRGRRHDLGIGVRDMAAGLGVELGRLHRMEDGTATDEYKTFYRTWLSRIEGWSAGERHLQLRGASIGRRFR
jgi:predicted transcriptional regulator